MAFNKLPRLFVDMDGTLAEWRNIKLDIDAYEGKDGAFAKINEILSTPGYFRSLKPHKNVVEAVQKIIASGEMEVYVLSCVLPDGPSSPQAEKEAWLDEYLPEIDGAHRIFVPDGQDKKYFVPGGVKKEDYLLDDYTGNLVKWSKVGTGIKLLNNVNSNYHTWRGSRVSFEGEPFEIAEAIRKIVLEGRMIMHKTPEKNTESFDYENFDFEGYV
jgi:5'(3')-deoxyribonucleotidase